MIFQIITPAKMAILLKVSRQRAAIMIENPGKGQNKNRLSEALKEVENMIWEFQKD